METSVASFTVLSIEHFRLSLSLDFSKQNVLIWMFVQFAFLIEFMLNKAFEKKMNIAIGILLCASIFLSIFSTNLFTFLFALGTSGIAVFINLFALGGKTSQAATSAQKHLSVSSVSWICILVGFAGVITNLGSGEFSSLAENGKSLSLISFPFLMVGVGSQFLIGPFQGMGKLLLNAEEGAVRNYLIAHFCVPALLLYRLSPAFHPVTEISDQVIVQIMILVFAVFSSLLTMLSALSEENSRGKTVWVYLFHGNMIFAMACVGASKSILPYAMGAIASGMLLSIALKKEPIESMPRLIALVVAWLVNLNIPLFSLGWAKITEVSEMLALFQVETSYLHAKIFLSAFAVKWMADVSFAIVMSATLLHVWKGREIKNSAFSWVDSIGVFLASILCFSLVAGGPLLGSALGESDFATLSHLQWLEEILSTSKLNLSFLPINAVIPLAVGMLGFFLSVFWLFQSKSRYSKGSEWAQKAIDSLKMHKKEPLLIWMIAFSPFFRLVKKPLRFLEEKVSLAMAKCAQKSATALRASVAFIETEVLEARFVRGIEGFFTSASMAARLFQTGKIQFYVGAAIVILFLLFSSLLMEGRIF